MRRFPVSFKQYVPDTSEDWDTYWSQRSIAAELEVVKTDGLNPIFARYLHRDWLCVEAGCGLGKWVVSLKNSGYQIIGLDNYVKGLEALKKHDPQLLLMAGDVAKLGMADNSIDAYISLGVVEHFEAGPKRPLAEAFRVVKPGQLAFIEVPFDSPVRQLTRFFYQLKVILKSPLRLFVEGVGLRPKRIPPKMIFYEYRYTGAELKNFVRSAGFQIIDFLPKDDLSVHRSIALWSDFPRLRHKNGVLFELNQTGIWVKKLLHLITPFSYPALIVAVCRKP